MKRRVRGLQRVLKVRDTQKRLKERALIQAGSHCAYLESNAKKIKSLHADTRDDTPKITADLFAAKMELSDRLLEASQMMDVSVQAARQTLAVAERQNIAAQAMHDGTEKLLKSKVSTLRKYENRKADISSNVLYNIDNFRKRGMS